MDIFKTFGQPITKELICEYVRQMGGGVSLVELKRKYADTTGEWTWHAHGRPNTIIWSGMSETFLDAVQGAIQDGTIELRATEWMVYMIDGGALHLPLAKRFTKKDFAKPRWVPCCLHEKKAPARASASSCSVPARSP
jgi:hypothetical protein